MSSITNNSNNYESSESIDSTIDLSNIKDGLIEIFSHYDTKNDGFIEFETFKQLAIENNFVDKDAEQEKITNLFKSISKDNVIYYKAELNEDWIQKLLQSKGYNKTTSDVSSVTSSPNNNDNSNSDNDNDNNSCHSSTFTFNFRHSLAGCSENSLEKKENILYELDNVKQKYDSLVNEVDNCKLSYDKLLLSTDAKSKKMEAEYEILHAELSIVTKEKTKLETKLDNCNKHNELLDSEIEKMKVTMTECNYELLETNNIEKLCHEKQTKIDKLSNEVDNLKFNNCKFAKQCSIMELDRQKLTDKCFELKQQIDKCTKLKMENEIKAKNAVKSKKLSNSNDFDDNFDDNDEKCNSNSLNNNLNTNLNDEFALSDAKNISEIKLLNDKLNSCYKIIGQQNEEVYQLTNNINIFNNKALTSVINTNKMSNNKKEKNIFKIIMNSIKKFFGKCNKSVKKVGIKTQFPCTIEEFI